MSCRHGSGDLAFASARRSESVQRETRAISVIGSEQIARAGVTNPDALSSQVPGLRIAESNGFIQVYIRGVGDKTGEAVQDPTVALSVDGIFYSRANAIYGQFFDLERVEVLKGPQGTLYGRNSTAGAINLITAAPSFDMNGFAEIEVGNYDRKRFTAAIGGPVSDKLAARVSLQYIDRDGYLSDGYNDESSIATRAQLLWQPTERDSWRVSASYVHANPKGDAGVLRGVVPDDPWVGPSDPRSVAVVAASNPAFAAQIGSDGYLRTRTYTFASDYKHEFEDFDLTVLAGYVNSRFKTLNFSTAIIPVYSDTRSEQKSLELRLSSSGDGPLKWLVGAFGQTDDTIADSQANQLFLANAFFRPHLDDRTWALFGEGTYSLTDALRVTGGLRYTKEKKKLRGVANFVPFPSVFPIFEPLPGAVDIGGDIDTEQVNYRAGVEYDVGPRSMLFANISSGFKAGGFYDDVRPNTYKPEKLTAIHAGSKNRFFDNRMTLNLEGFYWRYDDKQETVVAPDKTGVLAVVTANAGKATLYGAEASMAFLLTPNDLITGSVEYNHSEYDEFTVSQVQFSPTALPDTTCAFSDVYIASSGFPARDIDCAGKPLQFAARWTGAVGYQRTQDLGDAGKLVFNIQTQLSSSYYFSSEYTANVRQRGYHMTDATLSWSPASEKLTLTAFIKNIENEAVYTTGVSVGPFVPGAVYSAIRPPRTYGARLRVEF